MLLGQLLESRTRVGRLASAPLLSLLAGTALAAAGLLPAASPAFDAVWGGLMPLAVCLFLLEADLSRLAEAGAVCRGFALGAVGTVLGTLVAWAAAGAALGPEGWKLAAALCASYIGGSVNFAATAAALQVADAGLLGAGVSADMLCMAAYLALTMAWPVPPGEAAWTARQAAGPGRAAAPASPLSMAAALCAAALACCAGDALAARAGAPNLALALMAVAASAIASAAPAAARWAAARGGRGPEAGKAGAGGTAGEVGRDLFAGAEGLGFALMLLFFGVLGAGSSPAALVGRGAQVVPFILVQLAVHVAFTFTAGRFFKIPTAALLLASNANVGGPATAAAMAVGRSWPGMVQAALLTGSLGYAVGTSVGVGVGQFIAAYLA